MSIALDAFQSTTYDWMCGVRGTYAKARQAIDLCKREGILQGITMSLMKPNASEIFDLLDFCARTEMERCPVFVLRPVGRRLNVHKELVLVGLEYEKFLHRLFHRICEEDKTTPIDFFVYDPIYLRVLYQHKAIDSFKEYYPSEKLCGLGRYLDVDSQGDVACLFTDLKIGNIKEKPLAQIWDEATHSGFFEQIRNSKKLKGVCGKCRFNTVCGRCRTRAYKLRCDWFASDQPVPTPHGKLHVPKRDH